MKEKILRALREHGDEFVSGAFLCTQFGVSRQAVWKNITSLRENGYEIESVPNKGYRLAGSPSGLYAPDILSRLPEDCLCRKVECFGLLDSTNTKAKQLAELGEAEGTLVVAEEQTAGKGRRGRNWASEPGVGIWMTLVLRPAPSPAKVPGITLLTSLALTKALWELYGVRAEIKWPNDVILAKKKICGILTEMSSEENYVNYVVTGIGINANTASFPEEIAGKATSVFQQTGKKIDRSELIAGMIRILCSDYKRFVEEQDLSSFVEQYNDVLVNRDKEVCVYYGMVEQASPENTERGIARGIDCDGALLVEMDGRVKRILSGEVSVRGVYGYV